MKPALKLQSTTVSSFALLIALVCGAEANAQTSGELLPDIVVDSGPLHDTRIDTETLEGRRLLRLTTSTPNIGAGPLEIRGGSVLGTASQAVLQRIYSADGGFRDRPAGSSVYHPTHAHTHFDGWAIYRLRSIGPGGSVGGVVATGDKTSFCLLDITVYDGPGSPPAGEPRYQTCGQQVQGISPGWSDVYDRELEGQWIDVTDLPDGTYWLEAEVDPEQRIAESVETNNVTRIEIVLGERPAATPDVYEPNDTRAQSADLGVLDARRELLQLSMEAGSDYYGIRLEGTLPIGAHARVESTHSSPLELFLLDAAGEYLRAADGGLGLLSLAELHAGDYFLLVTPYFEENPEYRLVLDPRANQAPGIEVLEPGSPAVWVEHAFQALPVRWTAVDAENDLMQVALFIDDDGNVDDGTIALGGYQALAAEASRALINTAAVDVGVWFLLARVADGSGSSATWGPNPFVVYSKGDLNFDGHVDRSDWVLLVQRRRALGKAPLSRVVSGWERVLDLERDGDVDDIDIARFRTAALSGLSPDSHTR
jgi:hypothetical protein